MGVALTPLAAIAGGVLAVVLIFAGLWEPLAKQLERFGTGFRRDFDIAAIRIKPEALGSILLLAGAVAWGVLLVLTRPTLLGGIAEAAACALLAIWGGKLFLWLSVRRTLARFTDQLEGTLRQLAGAVRVGLGLRQALISVAEQSEEPTGRELTRVIGATNLGVPLTDALDALAERMITDETKMFAQIVRVQSRTGGDLGAVLDGLADTIRDRRRFRRRVSALTAQGRLSAWVVGALPVFMFLFIVGTQPELRTAVIVTSIGRTTVLAGFVLDALAAFVLMRITKVDA